MRWVACAVLLVMNIVTAFRASKPMLKNASLRILRSRTASVRAFSQTSTEGHDRVITPRDVDYAQWYGDILAASDMVDYSPVRGCMVIKPWGMGVWDLIRTDLDQRIKETDTQNAYFPLFIPKSFLAKEAQHVDGFAKECAVVTHHRLCMSPDGKDLIPDPDAKLEVRYYRFVLTNHFCHNAPFHRNL